MFTRDQQKDDRHSFCKLLCCLSCSFCIRHSQKKDISPVIVNCHQKELSFVKPVTNVHLVASKLPVGARLQLFWKTWLDLGAGLKVVQILRGLHPLLSDLAELGKITYHHKLLCQSSQGPLPVRGITSAYEQIVVKLVQNQKSLHFFNRLFLIPKLNNHWRPILDLSKLNLFLKAEKFKLDTLETIRTSLQLGEWVTSIDFKDAYVHITIQGQSRKYLRFHIQCWTYNSRHCHSDCPQVPWSSLI